MRRRGERNEEGEEREGGKEWRRKGMGERGRVERRWMCVWRGMGVHVEQKSSNQYFYKYLATSHLPV